MEDVGGLVGVYQQARGPGLEVDITQGYGGWSRIQPGREQRTHLDYTVSRAEIISLMAENQFSTILQINCVKFKVPKMYLFRLFFF